MNIMVTGAAGFIGGHLCKRLIADGHTVIGVDNLSTGRRSNLPLDDSDAFTFVEHDVCEPLLHFQKLDAIMHLASPASPPDYLRLPIETMRVGAVGTMNVIALAQANESCRVVFTSTSEVYGDPLVDPQPETHWGYVNPIGPRSVYDETKRYAEALLMAHRRTNGLDVRIARLFNTYGPGMRPSDGRVIVNFLGQALMNQPLTIYGDGIQTRSFCYVSDTVEALVRLLLIEKSEQSCGPINIGNPQQITIRQLAEEIIALTGSSSQITYHQLPIDDPRRRCPNIALARHLLCWEPSVSLRDGILCTMQMNSNGTYA